VSSLARSGSSNSIVNATSQGLVKEQIGVLVDMLRQLGGNARVVAGALAQADPLSSPFTLYVNPYIGSDRFIGGPYNTFEQGETDEEIIASKLKRIELQRLECGYTPYRPFRTINRAVIEAAIITSKNWYTYTDPRAHVDCVSIVLAPGVHILYNDPGSSSTNLASWGTSKDPTDAELIAFNPATVGGVLLPRGCSLCGPDLRKTTIRPTWVPPVADELADYSNRRGMLKITGTGYFFGFTVMDKVGEDRSHHLLDAFQFASEPELDDFYAKCFSSVGSGADLGSALTVTRPTEYEIVGPIDGTQNPTSLWDTTASASPYIFNCSIRSNYGICGAFMDGARVGGLKSMVCANFTGVSLQKDMTCWQVYENGNWVGLANTPTDYQKYISTPPDNVRMNPARLSRHITAVNDAFIQEVSVFAIGQGIHHFTDLGGEITVTNSNSSFGGCAALSRGYKGFAFPQDRNWTVNRIRVPLNLGEKTGNVRRIFLGVISAISDSVITLQAALATDELSTTVPALLLRDNYSLASGTRIWIENPSGDDWRTTLSEAAWSSSTPNQINIDAAPTQSGTDEEVGLNSQGNSLAIGKRVYIRRLVDTRSPSERRVSLQINNTASSRLPERNFVLQTDPARVGGAISRRLTAGGDEVLVISGSGVGPEPSSGVSKTSEITIRRASGTVDYANETFYRAGTIVRHANKHFQSLRDQTTTTEVPDSKTWGETFVHMPSDYNAEDQQRNEAGFIAIDSDTDPDANSTTLGIDWSAVWSSAGPTRDQYRSSSDYLGVYAFLRALGFTESAAHAALLPKAANQRDRNPASSTDFPTAPSGGAATGLGSWAIEFRRPSVLRLYGHAWEWAGYLNYSKSIPAAQKDLSAQNKFTYYFTNETGGRVVPQGSNEDGFNVSPKGLEDIETGATLTVDQIGSSTLDDFQRTDFPNGLTASEITVDILRINTSVQFPEVSAAKVDQLGPVRLASIEQVTATGSNAPVSTTDAAINSAPEAVTIGALNRWRQAQRLISAGTETLEIFVKAGAPDRNLESMLETPPTTPENAIPSLARASEYANNLLGGSAQTAEIRIAPGLYDPASVWQCNVFFVAYNATLTQRIWESDSAGTSATPNNYFDGSGYDNFNAAVNFWSFSLFLQDNLTTNQPVYLALAPRRMIFERNVDFLGGFHFLGLPHVIKAEANGQRPATISALVIGSSPLPGSAFSTNTATNVDTLISAIRVANNRSTLADFFNTNGLITLRGTTSDTARLRDLVFGPGLPMRKEGRGAQGFRGCMIGVEGQVTVQLHNIYIRGKTTITSAGTGITSNLFDANRAHYGTTVVPAPWTWEQTYPTFISPEGINSVLNLNFGSNTRYITRPSGPDLSANYYQDPTGKLLPNHIHLLTNNGAVPENDNSGPFFDQFIHAPRVLNLIGGWVGGNETREFTLLPRRGQGFVGKFGRNGYNSTKTRGMIGGNIVSFQPEHGFSISVVGANGRYTANDGNSLFRRAGVLEGEADSTVQATYIPASPQQGFGLGNPVGDNPVITTDTSGNAALNVGLRSYRRGISTEFAITIQPTNVIM
jgi:hypothetical protein